MTATTQTPATAETQATTNITDRAPLTGAPTPAPDVTADADAGAATDSTTGMTTSSTTGAPGCPKCGGRMWDNRATKRNPKAPDFKCRDRRCDGVLWPGQHKAAEPIIAPRRRHTDTASEQQGESEQPTSAPPARAGDDERAPAAIGTDLTSLRRCYLDVTDFVLRIVRPCYEKAGIPCTVATVAAIAATLFTEACTRRRASERVSDGANGRADAAPRGREGP